LATWRLTSTSLSNCVFTTLLTVDPAAHDGGQIARVNRCLPATTPARIFVGRRLFPDGPDS
jgi:hypothetical protein